MLFSVESTRDLEVHFRRKFIVFDWFLYPGLQPANSSVHEYIGLRTLFTRSNAESKHITQFRHQMHFFEYWEQKRRPVDYCCLYSLQLMTQMTLIILNNVKNHLSFAVHVYESTKDYH